MIFRKTTNLIVSCHVPKTAGTTFGKLLDYEFGEAVCHDYGDRVGWVGSEADKFRSERGLPKSVMSNDRIQVVHGHFYTSKYSQAFPQASYVTFLREPVSRVISNYQYLAEHSEINHPAIDKFHKYKPSLNEWIEWPETQNLQSHVLDEPLDAFAFIGITERFDVSLQMFDHRFGTRLGALDSLNLNVSKPLVVGPRVRARISRLNAEDAELYVKATERFAKGLKSLKS